MGKRTGPHPPKLAGVLREILKKNVLALMVAHFPDCPHDTARLKAAAKAANLGHGTIQRVLSGETAATLDTVERLALVFDLSAYQLLLPNLDVENPQVVKGATKEEQHLYANFKRERIGLPVKGKA